MKPREEVTVSVAGHEMRLQIEPEERAHVESAARMVTERLHKVAERSSTSSPARQAAMVAFQFACDLSIANELLDEAERLHEEIRRQREAISRLEGLLSRVDSALCV